MPLYVAIESGTCVMPWPVSLKSCKGALFPAPLAARIFYRAGEQAFATLTAYAGVTVDI